MFHARFQFVSRAWALQRQLNFPSQEWLELIKRRSKGAAATAEPSRSLSLQFEAEHASSLASFLRQWSSHILNGVQGAEHQAECQFFLEDQVARLDRMDRAAERKWQLSAGYVRERLTPSRLLHGLLAAMHLRNRGKLSDTLKHGLQSAGLSGDAVEEMSLHAPCDSQIQRSQVLIDSALCKYFAEEVFNEEPLGFLYLWADSSPQGGTDWLLSIVRIIPQKHVSACVAAATSLHASVSDFEEAVSQGDMSKISSIVQERHSQGMFLETAIRMHRQIPMGQGSGDTSLEKKLLCLIRKIHVEAGNLNRTCKILESLRGVCTDFGTEAGIANVEGIKVADVLPAWMSDAATGLVSEEDTHRVLESEAEDACADCLLPNALPLPGLLHIFHNMTLGIHSHMTQYNAWLPGFRSVAALLHHPHLRKRLIATCMLGTPWAWLQIKLQHGIPKPALWRWGAVSAIIPKVLALKHLLQQVWNPTKFANPAGEAASEAQQREAEEGGEDPDFQQQLVTETLRSEQWWLYTTMLGKLAQFSEDMTHWAEGCACHSWLHRKNAVQEVDEAEEPLTARDHLVAARCSLRLTNGEGDGINFQCPLAGQRAVELASGELWVFLETLSRNYIQEILSSNSCTDADAVQEVLDDFALGKSSMVEQLRIKLRCWQSLPWVLAALNSADAQHAREVAAEAMSRYDASPQDSCLHHRLTQKYLRQGCVARTELDKFVAGASLSDLPTLRDFVWGLRFLPTAERIQEGDHSVVKSLVTLRANRISGPYVSCKLRFPEIVDVVCKSEECRKLLAYFESIQDPDSIALQFGFWRHPLWIEARKQRYTRRLKLQVAASILYAMDAETQFTQVRAAAEKRKNAKKRRRSELRKL